MNSISSVPSAGANSPTMTVERRSSAVCRTVSAQDVEIRQFALDFNPERAARRNDPETSKAAARHASKFSESHAGRILLALQQHGPRTPKELEQLIGLSVVQIDRRLPDLKSAKLAEVVKLDDGADAVRQGCRVWRAVGG